MKRYHGNSIAFIDMLFNIVIVIVLLFFITVLFMNPPVKKNDIKAKADIIITMSWPDFNPHDIDVWIKPPEGPAIGYRNKENSYLFLDRDDLGMSNNYIFRDGKKVPVSTRREVISIRGKTPGRYIVNVFFFQAKGEEAYNILPVPVVVEMVEINPKYRILVKKEVVLTRRAEERTAFSFIVQNDLVTDITDNIEEPFILTEQIAGSSIPHNRKQ